MDFPPCFQRLCRVCMPPKTEESWKGLIVSYLFLIDNFLLCNLLHLYNFLLNSSKRLGNKTSIFGVRDQVERHIWLQHTLHVKRALCALLSRTLLLMTAAIQLSHMLFSKRVSWCKGFICLLRMNQDTAFHCVQIIRCACPSIHLISVLSWKHRLLIPGSSVEYIALPLSHLELSGCRHLSLFLK